MAALLKDRWDEKTGEKEAVAARIVEVVVVVVVMKPRRAVNGEVLAATRRKHDARERFAYRTDLMIGILGIKGLLLVWSTVSRKTLAIRRDTRQ